MEISSRNVVKGPSRAPHRAMYKAMGLKDEDLGKPFIGVSHTGNEATPCNIHLGRLAQKAKKKVNNSKNTPREFTTITINDKITIEHEKIKSPLVNKKIITDSIKLIIRAHQYDDLIKITKRDKSLPNS